MKKLLITIWDSSADRIIEVEKNLHLAAKLEGVEITVSIMSEIPLLGRNNMSSRIPVLEIENKQWTLRPHDIFTMEECRTLLHALTTHSQN